jgi:DNA-binding transcriptional MerR regulator
MAKTKYLKWMVARLCGVCEDTILNWEKKGIIPKAHRTPGGWRYWTAADVIKIKLIAEGV